MKNVTGKPYVKNYYERLGNKYNLKHTAFMTRNLFKVRWQKAISLKNNTFSFLKPNILDQYYGAGNLYMTPHDMGKINLYVTTK